MSKPAHFLQEAFLDWAEWRVTFSLLLLLLPEHTLGGWEVNPFRAQRVLFRASVSKCVE